MFKKPLLAFIEPVTKGSGQLFGTLKWLPLREESVLPLFDRNNPLFEYVIN